MPIRNPSIHSLIQPFLLPSFAASLPPSHSLFLALYSQSRGAVSSSRGWRIKTDGRAGRTDGLCNVRQFKWRGLRDGALAPGSPSLPPPAVLIHGGWALNIPPGWRSDLFGGDVTSCISYTNKIRGRNVHAHEWDHPMHVDLLA